MWTLDTRALNHILTHSVDYQKSEDLRKFVASLAGDRGIVFTEGMLFSLQVFKVSYDVYHSSSRPS